MIRIGAAAQRLQGTHNGAVAQQQADTSRTGLRLSGQQRRDESADMGATGAAASRGRLVRATASSFRYISRGGAPGRCRRCAGEATGLLRARSAGMHAVGSRQRAARRGTGRRVRAGRPGSARRGTVHGRRAQLVVSFVGSAGGSLAVDAGSAASAANSRCPPAVGVLLREIAARTLHTPPIHSAPAVHTSLLSPRSPSAAPAAPAPAAPAGRPPLPPPAPPLLPPRLSTPGAGPLPCPLIGPSPFRASSATTAHRCILGCCRGPLTSSGHHAYITASAPAASPPDCRFLCLSGPFPLRLATTRIP